MNSVRTPTFPKVACKENTWKSYQSLLRLHVEPEWTGLRLHEITRADAKRLLLQKQQEGLAPGTVQNIKAFISGLFTHAYEDEILDRNPALKLGKFIKKQDRRQHVRPLIREQVSAMLTVALVILILVCGGCLRWCSPGGVTSRPIPKNPGASASLETGSGKDILVAVSSEAFDRLTALAAADDDIGISHMRLAGQLWIVPSGTKCKIIDCGFTKCEVRLLEGTYSGRSCFVARDFVKSR